MGKAHVARSPELEDAFPVSGENTLSTLKQHVMQAFLAPPPPGKDDPLRVLRNAYLNARAYNANKGGERTDVNADGHILSMVNRLVELRVLGALAANGQAFVQKDMDAITASKNGLKSPYHRLCLDVGSSEYQAHNAPSVPGARGSKRKDVSEPTIDALVATLDPLVALIDKEVAEFLEAAKTKDTTPNSKANTFTHEGDLIPRQRRWR